MEVEKVPVKLTLGDSDMTADGGVCVVLRFTPRRHGLHSVDVRWSGLPVTGSPFDVIAVTAHASESEGSRLQKLDVVDNDRSSDHQTTAAVLQRTSKVSTLHKS